MFNKKIKCAICAKTTDKRKSHNGSPVTDKRVCTDCNEKLIIPLRIERTILLSELENNIKGE